MTKLSPGDIVEVRWHDSVRQNHGWRSLEEYRSRIEPAQSVTAGFYIGSSDGAIMVALSRSPQIGDVCDAIVIPTSAIDGVQVLGRATKKTRRKMA